jgi:hypothetical protein
MKEPPVCRIGASGLRMPDASGGNMDSLGFDKGNLSSHPDRLSVRKDAPPVHHAHTSFFTTEGRNSCVCPVRGIR